MSTVIGRWLYLLPRWPAVAASPPRGWRRTAVACAAAGRSCWDSRCWSVRCPRSPSGRYSIAVLLKVYAKCIVGRGDLARQRIEELLTGDDAPAPPQRPTAASAAAGVPPMFIDSRRRPGHSQTPPDKQQPLKSGFQEP
jgi:hypothetical protein